ncbi:hypothetical protein ACIO1C_22335 [Streptomyces sp. NPDC087420]
MSRGQRAAASMPCSLRASYCGRRMDGSLRWIIMALADPAVRLD